MKRTGVSEIRTLPFLHAISMLGIAAAWLCYCWHESPLRFAGASPRRSDVRDLEHALAIVSASLGDVVLGFCTIFILALGTGVYVRRLQTWIDARSSGEAVAYGGADLRDRALAANTDRDGRT